MSLFWYNPDDRFTMFSAEHVIVLVIALILCALLFIFRKPLMKYRRKLVFSIGLYFLMSNILLLIWYVTTDNWSVKSSLPLELCTIAALILGALSVSGKISGIPYVYFFAVGGAIQALMTPDLYYGPANFRFYQFFIDHILLVLLPVAALLLYKQSLEIKHFVYSFLLLNLIALFVFIINILVDANYMFLRYKPKGQSLLDYLGPYPYYLLSLEIVVLLLYFILYIPFKKKSSRS